MALTKVLPDMVASAMPDVGDYCMSARASKPGWLLCDGGAYSRAVYAKLYAEIGTKFGAGDGSTTFNVPGPEGKSLVVAGSGTIKESFAAAAVTVATDLITIPTNVDKWITGMKVRATTTGTLPTGLALATDYFVIRASATTIKLATTLALAVAGTAIDITAQGSGTHTLTHTLATRAIGDVGGEEMHAQTAAEVAPHSHPIPSGGPATGAGAFQNFWQGPGPSTGTATSNSAANAAMNNMSPFLVVGNLFIYPGV